MQVPGRKAYLPNMNLRHKLITFSWNGFPTIYYPSKRDGRERILWLGSDSSLSRIMKRNRNTRRLSDGLAMGAEYYSTWKRLTKRQDGSVLDDGDEAPQVLHNKWLKLGYVTG